MKRLGVSTIAMAAVALGAIVAILAWPAFVRHQTNAARAASLPTMAPVVADYERRDKLVAFWEGATNEKHRGDFLSPRQLSEQYLQRFREKGDIDDVLRAQKYAAQSLNALPHGNLGAELELASVALTLHQFHRALAITKDIETWDIGDDAMYSREASVDMEIGDYARAERLMNAVAEKHRDDSWHVIQSRYLELTGHLAEARAMLATAAAFQNSNFDAPAQGRAWYFFRQGEMAFEAGDNDAALAFEKQALIVFPRYADAFRLLAKVELSLHDWRHALSDAIASADLVPYPEALGYKADVQRAVGDVNGAAQTDDVIRTVQKIGDTEHITDRLLAIYYSEHRIHTAEAYMIAKNELSARDDIFTEDTLAWAAAMDGKWSEAETAIRKASAYGTQNSLLHYHAGIIALHFNHRATARDELKAALALNAHFHPFYADDARAQLTKL